MLHSMNLQRALRCIGLLCALLSPVSILLATGSPQSAQAEPEKGSAPVPNVVSVSANPSPPAMPAAPLHEDPQILATGAGTHVLVYPPTPGAEVSVHGAPMVVMLHGMCGDPVSICDFWNRAGREGSFLVCPEGNAACGEGRDWVGPTEDRISAVDASIAAVDEVYGSSVVHAKGDILIGFSRGAFLARDIAYARPGRWKAILFLGASLTPDAARLKASGIRRVVMAAGEYDGARKTMQQATRILNASGLPARYISLGRIPHALPPNLEDILRDALQWAREDDRKKQESKKYPS